MLLILSIVNVELSAKLENELAMEKEMRDTEQPPDHIREYMENTDFKIQDTLGQEEVILTRTFGDEKYEMNHFLSSPPCI